MSDVSTEVIDAKENLKYLKVAHDNHSTVVNLFSNRFQFFHEEFEAIQKLVVFYATLRDQVLAKIHEIEPPAPKEKKEPMIVDLPQAESTVQ